MPQRLLLACLLLLLPFFVIGGPSPIDSPLYSQIWNLGHLVFFALFTLYLWHVIPVLRRRQDWLALLVLSLFAFVFGLFIEAVQSQFSRDPDWHDVRRNLIGVWLAWFLLLRPPHRFHRMGMVGAIALLIFELGLITRVGIEAWRVDHSLPVIADLEHPNEADYWGANTERSTEHSSHGEYSAKVSLDTTQYSGSGPNRFPQDWRGYESLFFDIFNPDSTVLKMTLTIGDRTHYENGYRFEDRFNGRLLAEPGWNGYRVPLADIENAPADRPMDMKQVVTLGIFATRLPAPRVIYIDHLRLE